GSVRPAKLRRVEPGFGAAGGVGVGTEPESARATFPLARARPSRSPRSLFSPPMNARRPARPHSVSLPQIPMISRSWQISPVWMCATLWLSACGSDGRGDPLAPPAAEGRDLSFVDVAPLAPSGTPSALG